MKLKHFNKNWHLSLEQVRPSGATAQGKMGKVRPPNTYYYRPHRHFEGKSGLAVSHKTLVRDSVSLCVRITNKEGKDAMETPSYIKSLLIPNGKKPAGRKVWSIDLETVWLPFL